MKHLQKHLENYSDNKFFKPYSIDGDIHIISNKLTKDFSETYKICDELNELLLELKEGRVRKVRGRWGLIEQNKE